jgi:hypothetical protein
VGFSQLINRTKFLHTVEQITESLISGYKSGIVPVQNQSGVGLKTDLALSLVLIQCRTRVTKG